MGLLINESLEAGKEEEEPVFKNEIYKVRMYHVWQKLILVTLKKMLRSTGVNN